MLVIIKSMTWGITQLTGPKSRTWAARQIKLNQVLLFVEFSDLIQSLSSFSLSSFKVFPVKTLKNFSKLKMPPFSRKGIIWRIIIMGISNHWVSLAELTKSRRRNIRVKNCLRWKRILYVKFATHFELLLLFPGLHMWLLGKLVVRI